MDKYSVHTSNTVLVRISTSVGEKSIPIEKTFSKTLTIKDIKNKLEVVTAACSDSMKIKVCDKDEKIMFELDNDSALLGSYPVDSGMWFHVEDNFALKRMLDDETNVEKFEMSVQDYEKRDDTSGDGVTAQQSLYSSGGIVIPVGSSRGRGHVKSNIQTIKSLEYKPLRKPTIMLPKLNGSNNDVAGGEQNEKDDKTKTLNPLAEEFVPGVCISNTVGNFNKKTSEIEIIDPRTGLHVSLKSPSTDQTEVQCESESEFYEESNDKIQKIFKFCSRTALTFGNSAQSSSIKYEKEVLDILDLVESLLIRDPGLYIPVMAATNNIFCRWCGFKSTLEAVAQKIMNQSTVTKNYSYIGAKICSEFDKITLSNGIHPSFRTYILDECEKEFLKLKDLFNSDYFQKGHEVITFFAELYIQLTVKEKRIKSLGQGILESLNLLTDRNENVFCLCKILKLVGWALDEDFPAKMDEFKKTLPAIKHLNLLDASTTNMLKSVIDLATTQWGRTSSAVAIPVNFHTASNGVIDGTTNGFQHQYSADLNTTDYPYPDGSGKTYQSDGVVLSEEEMKFFTEHCRADGEDYDSDTDDGVISDHMDDEACEAYEQFLLMIPNGRSGTVNIKK